MLHGGMLAACADQSQGLPLGRAWSPPGLALHISYTLVLLLIAAAVPSRAQQVGVGGINVVSVVQPNEVTHKWWFWLIIAIIAAFFVVGAFFVWRGWRQWKKQRTAELQYEQELALREAKAGKRVQTMPVVPARGAAARVKDVELGVVGIQPPAPGEPLNDAQKEFLRERERRTAVHPKRHW